VKEDVSVEFGSVEHAEMGFAPETVTEEHTLQWRLRNALKFMVNRQRFEQDETEKVKEMVTT